MATTKIALKSAKTALDNQDYQIAVTEAQKVIEADQQNFFGHVFLGRALEKQDKLQEAIEAYKTAASIKPGDELPWKGLCNAYEALGSQGVDGYTHAAQELAYIYAEKTDAHQCQTVVDKLVELAKHKGNKDQYRRALRTILPGSPVFDFLEGRIPNPSLTYIKLAEINESEEKEKINKEIGERRTRLGANLSQVTGDVRREVFAKSELEGLYREIINWTADDQVRRTYEERLFQRAYDHLVALPNQDKPEKRAQVMKMARDMAIIKHAFLPAWELTLEWDDVEDLKHMDANVLREFIWFFPTAALSKALQAFLGEAPESEDIPNGANIEEEPEEKTESKPIPLLSEEDRLILVGESLEDNKGSQLVQRISSQYYFDIQEFESCVESGRRGLTLLDSQSRKSGLPFTLNRDAINLSLGTSLVYYQSPKNHPEAKSIFDEILKRKPDNTDALLGTGLILEERAEYQDASEFLDRALAKDPENVRIGAESAWCKVLTGKVEAGLEALEDCLSKLGSKGSLELRSTLLYRIGKALWDLRPDRASRKDRHGAYARFIASLKANPNFAPPYTSLGIYYFDYARDRKRARQCFQKAFDLSATEVESAERLARDFADDSEWDIVEIIAQRVIDSGVVRPAPGSKKKGMSWPFSALGIVQMNRQEYPRSVVSFQSALRISPSDFHSWVGLGESYHSSGRYIAARRALDHALELVKTESSDIQKEAWFARYMLSNVLRELGEYEEASVGYRAVSESRPHEFGVMIALLQTLNEQSWRSLETGFFGQAAESAAEAIHVAVKMFEHAHTTFNFWKAIGDICALFTSIPTHSQLFPIKEVVSLFGQTHDGSTDGIDTNLDGISVESIRARIQGEEKTNLFSLVEAASFSAIIAYKYAIQASSDDKHAQAVACYNLGWAELRAGSTKEQINSSKSPKVVKGFGKAAIRCFKRAIELEAGNAEFWNALGVATTRTNGRVAQHSFVRSLHLNSRNARTWTNLGTLYLLSNDHELAHEAFGRAQSTDPDYAYAWVGEGLIALSLGDAHEALSHFTHAMEISDASATSSKSYYVVAAYDDLLDTSIALHDPSAAIRPLFVMQQLQNQLLRTELTHLTALLQERVHDYESAVGNLEKLCSELEARYEESENLHDLRQFAAAKADLARNRVALGDFSIGSEDAETALDLLSETDSSGLNDSQRLKSRLSAHLTAGLAKHNLGAADEAIEMFRAALIESNSDPDVVCLLSQVLWAKGTENERNIAKEQLFECIENHPEHAQATKLIGAMSAVEGDDSTKDAVLSDLRQMRTSETLSGSQKQSIESLLDVLIALEGSENSNTAVVSAKLTGPIMLSPHSPKPWASLAGLTGDNFVADMTLKAAIQSAPPQGELEPGPLALAFANAPSIANAQRSTALQPWAKAGWEALELSMNQIDQ